MPAETLIVNGPRRRKPSRVKRSGAMALKKRTTRRRSTTTRRNPTRRRTTSRRRTTRRRPRRTRRNPGGLMQIAGELLLALIAGGVMSKIEREQPEWWRKLSPMMKIGGLCVAAVMAKRKGYVELAGACAGFAAVYIEREWADKGQKKAAQKVIEAANKGEGGSGLGDVFAAEVSDAEMRDAVDRLEAIADEAEAYDDAAGLGVLHVDEPPLGDIQFDERFAA